MEICFCFDGVLNWAGNVCAAYGRIRNKTSLHLCKSKLLGFRRKASSSSLINVELWAAVGLCVKIYLYRMPIFFEGLGPEMIAPVIPSKEKHTLKDNWLS